MMRCTLAGAIALAAVPLGTASGASHREAPVTALDRTADITDWYAFVSPDAPDTVTMIMAVDPLLEPANGPNYFPFDDNIRYKFLIDNDQDARPDVVFRVRFRTEQRLPGVPVGFIGAGDGIPAPPTRRRRSIRARRWCRRRSPRSTGRAPRASACARPTRSRWSGTAIATELANRTTGRWSRCRATSGRAPCPTTRACSSRASTSSTRACGCSPAPPTTPSSSTSARRSTRSTCACRCSRTRRTRRRARFAPDDVSGYNVNTIALQVPIEPADAQRQPAERRRSGRDDRHLRLDLAQADRGAPAGRADQGPGPRGPGPAHGQPAVQRAGDRHRLQGRVEPRASRWTMPTSPTSRSIR